MAYEKGVSFGNTPGVQPSSRLTIGVPAGARVTGRHAPPPSRPTYTPEQETALQAWRDNVMRMNGQVARLRRDLGPLGAPIWGTYALYAPFLNPHPLGYGRHIAITAAAIGAPVLGGVVGKRHRDDAVGIAGGALTGIALLGTAWGIFSSLFWRGT